MSNIQHNSSISVIIVNAITMVFYHFVLSPKQADAVREVLEDNGHSVTELSFDVASLNIDYNWAYINFLQIGNHIILPSFGIDEDSQAVSQVRNTFPSSTLHPFRCRDLANWGGALHCITWNIVM
ncbi:MAG: agmatine deiminase family protein [Prevotella sp.]|nr:agmatine deiminase family protein [Prevotella sp.]